MKLMNCTKLWMLLFNDGMDKSVAIVKETTNMSDMADTDFIA